MPRGDIEKANEGYVLRVLAGTRDGAGTKEVRYRVNNLLGKEQVRRRLTEAQALEVLESLTSQGKAAKQSTDPVTWLITPRGRGFLQ